jgi:hypothetical protein
MTKADMERASQPSSQARKKIPLCGRVGELYLSDYDWAVRPGLTAASLLLARLGAEPMLMARVVLRNAPHRRTL